MEHIDGLERGIASFRLTFVRTPNEGEVMEDIPRIKNGWPVERDFAKWPIPDQKEWCAAPVVGFLEDGLSAEKDGDPNAMDQAWSELLAFLRHIGIELDDLYDNDKLGEATANDLILEHYRDGKGYDCTHVVIDYLTFPPVRKLVREAKAKKRVQDEVRAQQKRDSKARRKPRHDAPQRTR